jgi:uridine kinase
MLFNSAHIYELGVLKKYAEPMLEAIGPEEEIYSEAVRLLRFLRYFRTIEDDSVIPNNSILREFIGGSILF